MKLLLISTMSSALALAAGCEDRFSKSGNPLTGTKYNSSVMVPGISVVDAIAQLHGIAVERDLDILTEDAPNGNMLLEDRLSMRHKAIPYVISVTDESGAVNVR